MGQYQLKYILQKLMWFYYQQLQINYICLSMPFLRLSFGDRRHFEENLRRPDRSLEGAIVTRNAVSLNNVRHCGYSFEILSFLIKALMNATNQQINENYCKRWFESFDLGYFSTMFLQNLKILSYVVEENQLSKPQNWQKLCQMSWSSKLKLVLEENFKVLTFDITKFMA